MPNGFGVLRQIPRPAWAGRTNDLQQWANSVVEKVRVGTTSGRLRFLPFFDPYTDETPEIRREYPKMLVESSVKAAFQTKVLAVISLPVTFNPPDDDDERQQEAARFAAWAFRKIHGGTSAAGWSILHPAVIKGLSVCEKVWEPAPERSGRWAGRRRYRVLKSKDTDYLQLGIDAYRNVTAIKGAGFNAGHIWNPDDFVLFSYMSLFENPSGMSDFRAAYRPYWIKHTVWQLRSLHLDKFVGPYLKGTYSTQDQKSALEAALEAARASTWFTVPAGVLVDVIDMSMRGTTEFESCLKDCDREILIAIVGAHLQILEGQTSGARGNTQVHKETAELIQWWLADRLARVYYDQMVCPLIAENYHDVEPPEVSVGAVTEAAMIEQLKVDDGLQKLGWQLSRSEIGKRYGRTPAADPEDVLTPAPAGQPAEKPAPGGAPAASPFSEGTAFCGGKGGEPGPCPEGGSKDQPAQTPHPHAGVAGVPEALSAAVESAKSRKELAQAVSATVNEAKAKVKQSVASAIQGIRTEELGQYKGGLQGALHSAIREHVSDFGRDLIGHLNHEGRYTVGQLKGGETKDQIRQAMGTAHDELGPKGVADKWEFNSRYLREDLASAFASHGHNPEQAATATEGIIASLGKRLGMGQGQHSEGAAFCQEGENKGLPGPCPIVARAEALLAQMKAEKAETPEARKERLRAQRKKDRAGVLEMAKTFGSEVEVNGDDLTVQSQGRKVHLSFDPIARTVEVDFTQLATGNRSGKQIAETPYDQTAKDLQAGTIELAHKFKEIVGKAKQAGLRIKYETNEPRRERLYARVLTSAGFKQVGKGEWKPKNEEGRDS